MLKLLSPKGTLIGTLHCPESWVQHIQQKGHITQYVSKPSQVYLGERADMEVVQRTFTIFQRYNRDFPDAVLLHGISIEEFEKLPGCSFSPSAAYLRSIME